MVDKARPTLAVTVMIFRSWPPTVGSGRGSGFLHCQLPSGSNIQGNATSLIAETLARLFTNCINYVAVVAGDPVSVAFLRRCKNLFVTRFCTIRYNVRKRK